MRWFASFPFVLSVGAQRRSRSSRRAPSTPQPAAATLRANGQERSCTLIRSRRPDFRKQPPPFPQSGEEPNKTGALRRPFHTASRRRCSVAVVLRLERAVHRHAQVVGLLLAEPRQGAGSPLPRPC